MLDELPQEERKAREATAAIVQNANTLDFDPLRAIAGSARQSYPIETVVPALEEFRSAVEENFLNEPSIELVGLKGNRAAYMECCSSCTFSEVASVPTCSDNDFSSDEKMFRDDDNDEVRSDDEKVTTEIETRE